MTCQPDRCTFYEVANLFFANSQPFAWFWSDFFLPDLYLQGPKSSVIYYIQGSGYRIDGENQIDGNFYRVESSSAGPFTYESTHDSHTFQQNWFTNFDRSRSRFRIRFFLKTGIRIRSETDRIRNTDIPLDKYFCSINNFLIL